MDLHGSTRLQVRVVVIRIPRRRRNPTGDVPRCGLRLHGGQPRCGGAVQRLLRELPDRLHKRSVGESSRVAASAPDWGATPQWRLTFFAAGVLRCARGVSSVKRLNDALTPDPSATTSCRGRSRSAHSASAGAARCREAEKPSGLVCAENQSACGGPRVRQSTRRWGSRGD